MEKMFETTSANVERFLFACGVLYDKTYRNETGETTWQYNRTAWLEEALEMYRRVAKRRRELYKRRESA